MSKQNIYGKCRTCELNSICNFYSPNSYSEIDIDGELKRLVKSIGADIYYYQLLKDSLSLLSKGEIASLFSKSQVDTILKLMPDVFFIKLDDIYYLTLCACSINTLQRQHHESNKQPFLLPWSSEYTHVYSSC